MSKSQKSTAEAEVDIEASVAEYLIANPDFFNSHLAVLEALQIPHHVGSAISLIERQLIQYREKNGQLSQKLSDLLEIARENDRLSAGLQALSLALQESTNLDDALHAVKRVLREQFMADFVALRLDAKPPRDDLAEDEEFVSEEALAVFDKLFKSGRPQSGAITAEQAEFLFHEAGKTIGSTALMPLKGSGWRGVLCVASGDPQRYHRGMGAMFLTRIGELVGHAIQLEIQGKG